MQITKKHLKQMIREALQEQEADASEPATGGCDEPLKEILSILNASIEAGQLTKPAADADQLTKSSDSKPTIVGEY